MESEVPNVTGKEMLKLLRKNEWELDRITGSHHVMVKGSSSVSVPVHHSKELKKGTEMKILKDAGLK
jgi:predicted RNA binding protein YcfA (HicA-like mRNA interferase family)